jgi:23S rRNA (pseudouridine1915-N3)-methyltransferase
LSSVQLAARLEEWQTRAQRTQGKVTFVIGGAEGIPSVVDTQANCRLSLSALTLPHRLVRLILFEQLYRAFTILKHEPYAREG